MAKEVTNLCKKISLTDEEQDEVTVNADLVRPPNEITRFCLIGKVLTSKYLNKEAFKFTMISVWKLPRKVTIKEVGDNLFVFHFAHNADLKKVLLLGPWNFDKALVNLDNFDGLTRPSNIQLLFSSFWIHVHDLPLISMTTKVAKLIGNKMGSFEDVDVGEGGSCWGRFLRIKVRMDITKPLRRGIKLNLPMVGTTWVSFTYERLPDFCFWCGCLGHIFKVCNAWVEAECVRNVDSFRYGTWLNTSKDSGNFKNNRNGEKEKEKEDLRTSSSETSSPVGLKVIAEGQSPARSFSCQSQVECRGDASAKITPNQPIDGGTCMARRATHGITPPVDAFSTEMILEPSLTPAQLLTSNQNGTNILQSTPKSQELQDTVQARIHPPVNEKLPPMNGRETGPNIGNIIDGMMQWVKPIQAVERVDADAYGEERWCVRKADNGKEKEVNGFSTPIRKMDGKTSGNGEHNPETEISLLQLSQTVPASSGIPSQLIQPTEKEGGLSGMEKTLPN